MAKGVYPVLVRLPTAPVQLGKDGLLHGERHYKKAGRPAGYYGGKDSQEMIDRCMSCPFPECKKGDENKCWYRMGKEPPKGRKK